MGDTEYLGVIPLQNMDKSLEVQSEVYLLIFLNGKCLQNMFFYINGFLLNWFL